MCGNPARRASVANRVETSSGVAVAADVVREHQVQVLPVGAEQSAAVVLAGAVLGEDHHQGGGKGNDAAGAARLGCLHDHLGAGLGDRLADLEGAAGQFGGSPGGAYRFTSPDAGDGDGREQGMPVRVVLTHVSEELGNFLGCPGRLLGLGCPWLDRSVRRVVRQQAIRDGVVQDAV